MSNYTKGSHGQVRLTLENGTVIPAISVEANLMLDILNELKKLNRGNEKKTVNIDMNHLTKEEWDNLKQYTI